MDDQWYAASMRVVCLVEPEGVVTQDDCVHIFRSTGWEEAHRRAIELGRGHEEEYLNADEERVCWRLDRVLTLDLVKGDLDGAEVFSRLSEVSGGAPFDSEFTPEDHSPEQTGI